MDKKQAHLSMIQGIINRLSQNSFLLKGWSVVLIAGLFALAAKEGILIFVYLAYFPLVSFWLLDGYFLWQERLYRALFDKVRLISEEDIDFSMSTKALLNSVDPWIKVTFSKTLSGFHGVLFGSVVIVMLALLLK